MRQQAARSQRHVADDLGVEPQSRLAGEQFVVRVKVAQIRPHVRGLAIGRGSDDEPVEALE